MQVYLFHSSPEVVDKLIQKDLSTCCSLITKVIVHSMISVVSEKKHAYFATWKRKDVGKKLLALKVLLSTSPLVHSLSIYCIALPGFEGCLHM